MLSVIYILSLLLNIPCSTAQKASVTQVVGVYQGKTLFIQNPYNAASRQFCVTRIEVNKKKLPINTRVSAIKLDFASFDLFTPVAIDIYHADSICLPVVLNADAIAFHSAFSFREIIMNDSVLTWQAVGDQEGGTYTLERYQGGIWLEEDTIPSKGTFEAAEYHYYPQLAEGANKYRVRYTYPGGKRYLYSREVDFHYYPDPVTFKPFNAEDYLNLSRSASYEIYDGGSNLVLSGTGVTIDVSGLPRGDYVIYFDGSDPGLFRKK